MITKNEARWIFYIIAVNSIPNFRMTQKIVAENIKGDEHDENDVFDYAIKFAVENGAKRSEKYLRNTMKSSFNGFIKLDPEVRQKVFKLESLPIDE